MLEPPRADSRSEGLGFFEISLLVVTWSIVIWLGWELVESSRQGDLAAYRRAGAVFRAGGSPYSMDGGGVVSRCAPLSLPLFGAIARLPASVSVWLWLAAKAACFGVLLRIARRCFAPFRNRCGSLAFLVFAFNGTLYADLAAGNVSLFQHTFFWSAIAACMAGRRTLFVLFTILAAQLDLGAAVPLLFVAAVVSPRPYLLAASTAGALLAILGLQWLAWPALTRQFLGGLVSFEPWPHEDTSSYSLAREIARGLTTFDPLWKQSSGWLYLVFVVAVIVFAGSRMRLRRDVPIDPAWSVAFITFTYAIVTPHFNECSYGMLLIPAWLALSRNAASAQLTWLPLLVGLPLPKSPLPIGELVERALGYAPWAAAMALFVVLARGSLPQRELVPVESVNERSRPDRRS